MSQGRHTQRAQGHSSGYVQAIDASPDNLDAMAGLGLSLVNAGYINDNKVQLQEGANYLQKFASAAPDSNSSVPEAVTRYSPNLREDDPLLRARTTD